MSDLNQFCCTARLTRDPETRFLANEKCVASIGLAIGNSYTKDGTKHDEVVFLDAEAWGRLGEICGQYLTKGKQVALSGRLKQDTWEDKNGGGKRSKIKLVIDSMTMLGSKPETAGAAPDSGNAATPPPRPSRPAREAEASGGRFGGEDEPPF